MPNRSKHLFLRSSEGHSFFSRGASQQSGTNGPVNLPWVELAEGVSGVSHLPWRIDVSWDRGSAACSGKIERWRNGQFFTYLAAILSHNGQITMDNCRAKQKHFRSSHCNVLDCWKCNNKQKPLSVQSIRRVGYSLKVGPCLFPHRFSLVAWFVVRLSPDPFMSCVTSRMPLRSSRVSEFRLS